jgi:catechol 2,3-dioxygenase-like lactoylglutathione lyase family enzyme
MQHRKDIDATVNVSLSAAISDIFVDSGCAAPKSIRTEGGAMPTTNANTDGKIDPSGDVENTIPVLAVSDLQASIRFYRDMLGFKLDWGGENDLSQIASVSRDSHAIMLQHRGTVSAACVWIGGTMLVPLWDKIRSRGDDIAIQRPTNWHYALDMRIRDPDGNILWFGTEPLEDVPFGIEPADSQLPGRRASL